MTTCCAASKPLVTNAVRRLRSLLRGSALQAAEKLLWKLNGGETCSFKRSPHGKVRDSLLFSLLVIVRLRESTCNSNLAGELARNSLESLLRSLSAELISDFGHKLRFLGFIREKFAAKFPEAGNLKLQDVSQISHLVTTRSDLDIDRFPQHFSAGCFQPCRCR